MSKFAIQNKNEMLTERKSYNDAWQNCLNLIREKTSTEEFTRWFQPIVPLEFDGNVLKLRVPTEKHAYEIERNYMSFFRPIIHKMFGLSTKLRYTIFMAEEASSTGNTAINNKVRPQNSENIQNPFVIPGIKKIMIDPQLNPKYNFESFVEGDCNRMARSIGMSIAENPGKTFNPMFIFGDSGLGKTHVVQAIGMAAKKNHPELNVLYVSANKFQAQFQNAATKGELNDFIHFYQMIDLLIIDDIQELSGKPKTQNTFFNIFNNLHLNNKQLIITSDKSPVELQDMEQRLLTRFKWGLTTQLQLPDYQTKSKIIQAKSAKLGIDIPEEVIEFLANNITANVREIEGALSALGANAAYLNRKITVSLAREILRDYVQYTVHEITIEDILDEVSRAMNIDLATLNSARRTREVAQARQLAMYLCKQHTKASLNAIGSAIGGKNHATVLHANKTIANLLDTDKVFKAQVETIERAILAR